MPLPPEEIVKKLDKVLATTVLAPDGEDVSNRVKRPRLDTSRPTHPKRGGWHGHPNSLLALELHRGRTQFGAGGLRTCSHCGDVAVRGLNVCTKHGGAAVARARRLADNCALYSRVKEADRVVRKLIAAEALPAELCRNSVFIAVHNIVEAGRVRGVTRTRAEIDYLRAAKLLRFELVRAWMTLISQNDAGAWVAAVAKARQLSFI